jgi:hypothetical protein
MYVEFSGSRIIRIAETTPKQQYNIREGNGYRSNNWRIAYCNSNTYQLRTSFDKLQIQNSDIVHSLNNQVTLVKKLSLAAEINADTVMNLTDIVKDNIVQSYEKLRWLVLGLKTYIYTMN